MADLCRFCVAIPFNTIPQEDEDAWPHHATWESLKILAATCQGCEIIQLAVERLYRKICLDYENSQPSISGMDHG